VTCCPSISPSSSPASSPNSSPSAAASSAVSSPPKPNSLLRISWRLRTSEVVVVSSVDPTPSKVAASASCPKTFP